MKKIIIYCTMLLILITGVHGAPVICYAEEKAQVNKTGDLKDGSGWIEQKDGTYSIEVELSGGSGRAAITSPTLITVSENTAIATIEWSSPYYDYMIVNGETYFPVNTEGNSVFEIPVLALDEEIEVIADTTAMSVPHEVEYTLIFYSDSIQPEEKVPVQMISVVLVLAVALAVVILIIVRKKKEGYK